MMVNRSLDEVINDLRQTQQSFLNLLKEAEPAMLYHRSAADTWTIAEVLTHIAEAREFYTREIQTVLEVPGSKIGRTTEHPDRLRAIEEHGDEPPDALRSRLIASYERMLGVLQQMSEGDLEKRGEHLKHGPQSLQELVHFLVEHDQVHTEQVKALFKKSCSLSRTSNLSS